MTFDLCHFGWVRTAASSSCVLKYTIVISKASSFKKATLDLITDVNMLLIVEKGIRGGICHSI